MQNQNDIDLLYHLYQEQKESSEKSFFNFFVSAWPILEPRFKLDCNWHIGLIGEYLESVYEGDIEKLVVNIPTRYLKTQLCTIAFPAWVWIKDARKKFISWGYSNDLSVGMSWKRRELIESQWYKMQWGDKYSLKGDQNTKGKYANNFGGSMLASSTGGIMTGEGCDIMIIDDPVKPSEAASDNLRIKANDFWSHTASSRFDDKKRKSCVLVMQRLHERDLSGHFLKEYPECIHLKIPQQAPIQILFEYPKSKKIKVYEEGEILQPTREGEHELIQAKKELGSFNYAGQRMQDPVPRGGGIFKEHWFNYYDILPESFDLITLSLDCTFKDIETSDYVVLQAWGQIGSKHYLIKQLRARMGFAKTKSSLVLYTNLFTSFHEALIEDKANGTAIIETLSDTIRSLIAINPKESKIARAVSCEPEIEAGGVYLPNPDYNPWVKEVFLREVCAFPKAPNDDQVDAMTQYLNRAKTRNIGIFIEEDENNSGETFAASLESEEW